MMASKIRPHAMALLPNPTCARQTKKNPVQWRQVRSASERGASSASCSQIGEPSGPRPGRRRRPRRRLPHGVRWCACCEVRRRPCPELCACCDLPSRMSAARFCPPSAASAINHFYICPRRPSATPAGTLFPNKHLQAARSAAKPSTFSAAFGAWNRQIHSSQNLSVNFASAHARPSRKLRPMACIRTRCAR